MIAIAIMIQLAKDPLHISFVEILCSLPLVFCLVLISIVSSIWTTSFYSFSDDHNLKLLSSTFATEGEVY